MSSALLASKIDSPYDQERAIQAIIEAFTTLGEESETRYVVAYGDEKGTTFLVGPSLTELFERLLDECLRDNSRYDFCFGLRIPGVGVGGAAGFLDAQSDVGSFTSIWGSSIGAMRFVEELVRAIEGGEDGFTMAYRIQA